MTDDRPIVACRTATPLSGCHLSVWTPVRCALRCSGAWLRGWGCAAGLTLWRWALCAHFAAMLLPGERRITRFVRCAHAAQTAAASTSTKHAARASPGPALLAATEIAPPHSPSRKARGVGARSAHRALTHRRCLSGSEAQRNGSEFRRCDRPLSTAKAVAAGDRHREAPVAAHTGLGSKRKGATFSVAPHGSTV